jgi:hypothetical protein
MFAAQGKMQRHTQFSSPGARIELDMIVAVSKSAPK